MGDATPPTTRYSLRDLPIPAKLVVSCFLVAVGFGYFSALVQIHMQHSLRNGEPMPTIDDIIEKFSGLKPFDGTFPKSKIETMISGDHEKGWGKENMTPAFFDKSGSKYQKDVAKRGKDVVDKERDGERLAMIEWINLEADARKKAFADDKFAVSETLSARPITEEFYDHEAKTVAIASLVDARCGKCHAGDQKPDLIEYTHLEPLVTAPKPEVIDGRWVRSPRQMSVDGLTQSTHAHLLSFAILFSLTGLIFAFTNYPVAFRVFLAPLVVVTQVVDVACWWLARVDTVGPTFATMILITGSVVGVGLFLQILLSLFAMYGPRGKIVLVAFILAASAAVGVVWAKAIAPGLASEKAAFEQQKAKPPEAGKKG